MLPSALSCVAHFLRTRSTVSSNWHGHIQTWHWLPNADMASNAGNWFGQPAHVIQCHAPNTA